MSSPLYVSSSTVSRRVSALRIGVFATAILFASSVASVDACTPTADTVCEDVSLSCIDFRNVSHFLSDVTKIQFIEDHITESTLNLSQNSSMNYRFDFTGSTKVSDLYPLTFDDVHQPIIANYSTCEEYVEDFEPDLISAIGDYLEMSSDLAIVITGCELDFTNAPAPAPAPSRKLLTLNATVFPGDIALLYGANSLPNPPNGQPIVDSPDERGVNSASVEGDISTSKSSSKRRLMLSTRNTDDSICAASLKFRGLVARSLNDTMPWLSSSQFTQSFLCYAEFRERSVGGSVLLTTTEACAIEEGLKFMEESCGPSPVKSATPPLDDFAETFPPGFDPVAKVLPIVTNHVPPSPAPDFLPDTSICNSSPEILCDLKVVFGEEIVPLMLSWYTPNDSPSLALLQEYYQTIC